MFSACMLTISHVDNSLCPLYRKVCFVGYKILGLRFPKYPKYSFPSGISVAVKKSDDNIIFSHKSHLLFLPKSTGIFLFCLGVGCSESIFSGMLGVLSIWNFKSFS